MIYQSATGKFEGIHIPDKKEIQDLILSNFKKFYSTYKNQGTQFQVCLNDVSKHTYLALGFKRMDLITFRKRFIDSNFRKNLLYIFDSSSKT